MAQSSPDDPAARTIASQSSSLALSPGSALSSINVPELVEMIISNLTRKDNTSAARVCRMWSEPALDRIWHHLISLAPLLSLVGPICWRTRSGWEFKRGIQDADWSRYAFYAPRIRTILFNASLPNTRVSEKALRAIVDHLPSHLELPHPSFITVCTTSPAPAISLISQSLRALSVDHVRTFSSENALGRVPYMRAVISAAAMLHDPCLESLHVGCCIRDAALLEALIMCLVKHSSKISRLTASLPFDRQLWASVFGLPALRSLDIAPLSNDVPGPSEEILSMLQTLVAEQPLLKILRLHLPFPTEQSQDGPPYSQLIHELMGLRNLETLALHLTAPLSLSESDVRDMGDSWPNIRNLEFHPDDSQLSGMPPLEITAQSDLSLLPSFIRYLPSLEELHILLACNPPLTAPQERFPTSTFRILNVGASQAPAVSSDEVVSYLAAVLPHAAHIQFSGGSSPLASSVWRSIASNLASRRETAPPSDTHVIA